MSDALLKKLVDAGMKVLDLGEGRIGVQFPPMALSSASIAMGDSGAAPVDPSTGLVLEVEPATWELVAGLERDDRGRVELIANLVRSQYNKPGERPYVRLQGGADGAIEIWCTPDRRVVVEQFVDRLCELNGIGPTQGA